MRRGALLALAENFLASLDGEGTGLVHVANPGSKEDEQQNYHHNGTGITPAIWVSGGFNFGHANTHRKG